MSDTTFNGFASASVIGEVIQVLNDDTTLVLTVGEQHYMTIAVEVRPAFHARVQEGNRIAATGRLVELPANDRGWDARILSDHAQWVD